MSDIQAMKDRLNEKIPRDVVKKREGGGGKSFSYLEGHYVIARLNEIFGNGGWSYTIKHLEKAHTGQIKDKWDNDVHTAHYIANVELVVPALNCVYGDVGYGDGSDKLNLGKAHELAVKEAVTDALKRCAKNLGMSMGLALYDKTQENVDDGDTDTTKGQSAPRARNTRRAEGDQPASLGSSNAGNDTPPKPAPLETSSGPSTTKSRAEIDELIQKTQRVAIGKRATSKEKLKEALATKYNVAASKELNDAQATEFLGALTSLIGG